MSLGKRLGLDASGGDIINFLITILLLGLDHQFAVIPFWLRVQGQESLLDVFCVKFDENAAFEKSVIAAT